MIVDLGKFEIFNLNRGQELAQMYIPDEKVEEHTVLWREQQYVLLLFILQTFYCDLI